MQSGAWGQAPRGVPVHNRYRRGTMLPACCTRSYRSAWLRPLPLSSRKKICGRPSNQAADRLQCDNGSSGQQPATLAAVTRQLLAAARSTTVAAIKRCQARLGVPPSCAARRRLACTARSTFGGCSVRVRQKRRDAHTQLEIVQRGQTASGLGCLRCRCTAFLSCNAHLSRLVRSSPSKAAE